MRQLEVQLVLVAFLALWLFPWPLVLLSVIWAVSTLISRGAKVNLRLSLIGVKAEFSGEFPRAGAALP